MDTTIKESNKIQAGCDKYTSPEEIQALSKYLKKKRQELDDSIELGKDNLEVPGRKYGSIKNIDTLSEKLEVLDKKSSASVVSKLVNESDWIDSGKNLEQLEKLKNNIIPGPEKKSNLVNDRNNIIGKKEIDYSLPDNKIDVSNILHNASLSGKISWISGEIKNPILENSSADLKVSDTNSELGTIRKSIEGSNREPKELESELNNKLNNEKKNSLSNEIGKLNKIEKTRDSSLYSTVNKINNKPGIIDNISSNRENIKNKTNVQEDLSTNINKINEINFIDSLDNTSSKINVNENIKLDLNKSLITNDKSIDGISNEKEKIEKGNKVLDNLDGDKKDISGEREKDILLNDVIKNIISGDKNSLLTETRDNVKGNPEKDVRISNNLENTIGNTENLGEIRSSYSPIQGEVKKPKNLNSSKESLRVEDNTEISRKLNSIIGESRKTELSKTKDELENIRNDISLISEKELIEGNLNYKDNKNYKAEDRDSLDLSLEKLNINKDTKKLDKDVKKLNDSKNNLDLENNILKLQNNSEEEISLRTNTAKIGQKISETVLESELDKITDEKNLKNLSSDIDQLAGNIPKNDLNNSVLEKTLGEKKKINLEKENQKIKGALNTTSLERNKIEKLEVGDNVALGNEVKSIKDISDDIELDKKETYKLNESNKIESLSSIIEKFKGQKEPSEITSERQDLVVEKETKSLSQSIEIVKGNNVGVDSIKPEVEQISGEFKPTDIQDSIIDVQNAKNITDQILQKTSKKLDVADNITGLLNTTSKVEGVSKQISELENNGVESVEGLKKNSELNYDLNKIIGNTKNSELDYKSVSISEQNIKETSLETNVNKLKISEDKKSLENNRENINGNYVEDTVLSQGRKNLDNTKEIEKLKSIQENLNGVQDVETITGKKEKVVGNVNNENKLSTDNQHIQKGIRNDVELEGESIIAVGEIKNTVLDTDLNKIEGEFKDRNLENNLDKIEGDIKNTVLKSNLNKIEGESEDKSLENNLDKVIGESGETNLDTEITKINGNSKEVNLEIETDKIIGELESKSLETRFDKVIGESEDRSLENNLNKVLGKPEDKDLESNLDKVLGKPEDKSLESNLNKIIGESEDKDLESNLDKVLGKPEDNSLESNLNKIIGESEDKSLENNLDKIEGNLKNTVLESNLNKVLGKPEDKDLESNLNKIEGESKDKDLESNLDKIIGESKDRSLENNLNKIEGNLKNTVLESNLNKIEGESKDKSLESNLNKVLGKPEDKSLENFLSSLVGEQKTDSLEKNKLLISGVSDTKVLEKNKRIIIGEQPNNKLSDNISELTSESSNNPRDLSSLLVDIEKAKSPNTDQEYWGDNYNPSIDGLGPWKGSDNPKIEPDKTKWNTNLSKEETNVTEDDTSKLDTSGEASHSQFENIVDGKLYDSNLSVTETDQFILDEDSKTNSIWNTNLVRESQKTNNDDTNKINLGKNYKRDKEGSRDSDDYKHTSWNETLDTGLSNIEKAKSPNTDQEYWGDNYNPSIDGLGPWKGSDNPKIEPDKTKWNTNLETDVDKTSIDKNTSWNENLETNLNSIENPRDKDIEKLENNKPEIEQNKNEDSDIEELKNIFESRKDLTVYYNNILKFAQGKDFSTGWGSRVSSLMSTYLSGNNLTKDKADEFERQLYGTIIKDQGNVKMARYHLQVSWNNALNANKYIRWLAEKSVGWINGSSKSWLLGSKPDGGNIRQAALDLMLMTLVSARRVAEVLTKSNRDRLPGSDSGLIQDVIQGVDTKTIAKKALSKIGTAIIKGVTGDNEIDKSAPLNRPYISKAETGWVSANKRASTSKNATKSTIDNVPASSGKGLLGKVFDIAKKVAKTAGAAAGQGLLGSTPDEDYSFNSNYMSSWGINTTLSDLCGIKSDSVNSVEDLRIAIDGSPYMTCADKFTTTQRNSSYGNVQTLDDNSYWEIVFDPYAGADNGNKSFLPSIDEINVFNLHHFGVYTGYNRWIPFVSFDLSKSKVTSKSLGLFDGEISYPVSIEFTNELRITIADDQYKSWRTYFERCADASLYNSESHDSSYYGYATPGTYAPTNNLSEITAIDKTNLCPALYKNVTFRCIIYSLTPQLETISKYDLLVVLKDFAEERSGDIDSGGSDLNLVFSIVGENPKDKFITGNKESDFNMKKTSYETSLKLAEAKRTGELVSSIASGTLSQALKLIGV